MPVTPLAVEKPKTGTRRTGTCKPPSAAVAPLPTVGMVQVSWLEVPETPVQSALPTLILMVAKSVTAAGRVTPTVRVVPVSETEVTVGVEATLIS